MAERPAAAQLLAWYRGCARDLPWRRTRDPYRILVSEVMLQQTQVERVLPYYQRFLERFPDHHALAAAGDEDIHRLWKGLGYPSRVERLRSACREVASRGRWPDTAAGLEELPGIGPYTAAAVACFAFGRAEAVVDTNVARVYARRDRLPLPLDRAALWAHARAELAAREPVAYNNALMELGALVCTARAPRCGVCPWRARCAVHAAGDDPAASANPLRAASPRLAYGDALDRTLPRSHVVLALVHHEHRYLVALRPPGVHQGGRWELPGGKREAGEDDRTALARELWEELGAELLAARHLLSWHHRYPDRLLTFHLYRCRLFAPETVRPLAASELRWVDPATLLALDFPPANRPLIERLRRYHRLDRRS